MWLIILVTDIRWVKIFTWRGNGDGINPFSNGLIEDCFIRTQDDSTYVNMSSSVSLSQPATATILFLDRSHQ